MSLIKTHTSHVSYNDCSHTIDRQIDDYRACKEQIRRRRFGGAIGDMTHDISCQTRPIGDMTHGISISWRLQSLQGRDTTFKDEIPRHFHLSPFQREMDDSISSFQREMDDSISSFQREIDDSISSFQREIDDYRVRAKERLVEKWHFLREISSQNKQRVHQ